MLQQMESRELTRNEYKNYTHTKNSFCKKNEIELQQLLEKNDFKKTTMLTEEPFKENMGHSNTDHD